MKAIGKWLDSKLIYVFVNGLGESASEYEKYEEETSHISYYWTGR